jgi:hypothetical protein
MFLDRFLDGGQLSPWNSVILRQFDRWLHPKLRLAF